MWPWDSEEKKQEVLVEVGIWTNNLDDLVFGLAVCIFTFTVGNILRTLISRNGKFYVQDPLKSRVLYEIIGTAELAVASFELVYIVYDNYSIDTFLIGVFAYSIYATSGDDEIYSISNPVDVVSMYLNHEIRFEIGVIVILAQFVGAFLPYFLIIKPAWKSADLWYVWKDENIHAKMIMEPTWKSAVNPTNPMISALSEGLITCLMYLSSRFFTIAFQDVDVDGAGAQRFVTIFVNTLIGGIGPQYSGGFYNPATATALEFYITTGVNLGTKIWVYWVAPIIGIVAGLFLERLIFSQRL